MSSAPIPAPFPYFGGKSLIASAVWERLGNIESYVEPFAGSLAVLLARPHEPGIETVNDVDGLLANFWRAIQADPDTVAHHADWPVNEADLHARHLWLVGQRESLTERLMGDPDWYDAKAAGWWVWGASAWIGGGWCSGKGPWISIDGRFVDSRTLGGKDGPGVKRELPRLHKNSGVQRTGVEARLPHMSSSGQGVQRQLPSLGSSGARLHGSGGVQAKAPHLGNGGRGVNRTLPSLGNLGKGVHGSEAPDCLPWFYAITARLRRVRVACGDWSRVTGPAVLWPSSGICGVLLDPPYAGDERASDIYASDDGDVSAKVRAWAIANGDNPKLRIALCGYKGEHDMPSTWSEVGWKAQGGYGNKGDGRGRENAYREVIWFSPFCLGQPTWGLFEGLQG